MRRFVLLIFCLAACIAAFGQDYEYSFTEASDLTLFGIVFEDTPNPYQRMDFTRFGGWTVSIRVTGAIIFGLNPYANPSLGFSVNMA